VSGRIVVNLGTGMSEAGSTIVRWPRNTVVPEGASFAYDAAVGVILLGAYFTQAIIVGSLG